MIYDALVDDHEELRQLLRELDETDDNDVESRDDLFQELSSLLTRHTRAEEAVFYPRLRDHEETRGLVEDSVEDHETLQAMLPEVEALGSQSEEWKDALLELKDTLERHLETEEREVFDKARGILSESEARELGRRFRESKKRKAS